MSDRWTELEGWLFRGGEGDVGVSYVGVLSVQVISSTLLPSSLPQSDPRHRSCLLRSATASTPRTPVGRSVSSDHRGRSLRTGLGTMAGVVGGGVGPTLGCQVVESFGVGNRKGDQPTPAPLEGELRSSRGSGEGDWVWLPVSGESPGEYAGTGPRVEVNQEWGPRGSPTRARSTRSGTSTTRRTGRRPSRSRTRWSVR